MVVSEAMITVSHQPRFHTGLLSPTINLIITIKKSSESCSNWTFIPCFPGDTENNCERCTEGPGLEYTVTWERKDGSTGDDFLIKWGPGVLWTDRNVMVIPSGLSSEIIVPSVSLLSYCFRIMNCRINNNQLSIFNYVKTCQMRHFTFDIT